MAKKSILEQALLQVQTLEEAVKANAKGILASTMKQELNDLLKEQEDLKLDPEEEEQDVTDAPVDDETSIDNDELAIPSDEDPVEGMKDEPTVDDDFGDNFDQSSDEMDDVLDMTNASEDEILKVFKAMKPDDGIVVKKDGQNIELSDEDNEYIIKLGDEDPVEDLSESFIDDEVNDNVENSDDSNDSDDSDDSKGKYNDFWSKLDQEEDEVIFEIELDQEEDEVNAELEENKEECTECGDKKIEATEASRTIASGVRSPAQKKTFKAGRYEMNEEVAILKKQNAEYKKALVLFKEKLNEVAVFNGSLAYATRLFTEHSTTKQEKLNILKRFDSIATITECKNLYKTIKNELDTKKPITESVIDKIVSSPKSSSSEILSESKAYENPQFKRMKELMNKINNK